MKLETDIDVMGSVIPFTADVTDYVNSIKDPNLRCRKVMEFMDGVNLADIELSDLFIAIMRKKMIALNAKFKFKSNAIAKSLLSWYIERTEERSYIDIDETFENFIKEMGQPKI